MKSVRPIRQRSRVQTPHNVTCSSKDRRIERVSFHIDNPFGSGEKARGGHMVEQYSTLHSEEEETEWKGDNRFMQLLQPEFEVSEDRYLNADYHQHRAGGRAACERACNRVVDRAIRHTMNRNVVLAFRILLPVLLVHDVVAVVVSFVTDAAEALPWPCAKLLSKSIATPTAKTCWS